MSDLQQYFKELNVLYVDDDEETLQLYSSFLNYYVKSITTCNSAMQALDTFEDKKFDIIISDIEMPKMNGIEFIQQIRQKNKDVRVIMLTAYTDAKYTIPSIELDITRYLVKPVSKTALFEALKKCYDELYKNEEIIQLTDDTTYNIQHKELKVGDEFIKLQRKPLLLLDTLVRFRGKTITYEEILKCLSSDEEISMNAVRCHMRLLRKTVPKLNIQNISGVGYKLSDKE